MATMNQILSHYRKVARHSKGRDWTLVPQADRTCLQDLIGVWTFPYRNPTGTKAVQVVSIDGQTAHLSDGTTMHVSYVRIVTEGSVA